MKFTSFRMEDPDKKKSADVQTRTDEDYSTKQMTK
jgi:hypothetical protein